MSIQSQMPQAFQAMQHFDPNQINQPQQQSHIIDDIPHGPINDDNHDDDDDDSESEYEIDQQEMGANGGGDDNDDVPQNVNVNKEASFVNEDDLKERKEDEDEDDNKTTEHPLSELGNVLKTYGEDRRYKCNRNRSAFIVMYNTQIYVEDKILNTGDGINRIPITVNATTGQW
eukprot:CAMPEP_0201584612 /NCGR_PEP_ID=MMETSP0190_2-20130828/112958_1 /ASSEMBLY_ACC=CAM_ASM_000263 /TAXON_ID=37353 /ORGANISM="Rosalina sp." /LENGTH=172 /DNA_ID=CAMNT_0048028947 /DNA_START=617 /DNA_END=1132 /DNA_ORIENTATION=+